MIGNTLATENRIVQIQQIMWATEILCTISPIQNCLGYALHNRIRIIKIIFPGPECAVFSAYSGLSFGFVATKWLQIKDYL